MNLILFIARFLLISRNGATTFVTVVYNRKFHNKYLTHIILHKVVVLLFLSLSLLWKFSNEIFFFSRFHAWRNLETFDCIIVFISRYSSYFRNNKNGMELRKDNREEEKEIVFINFLIFTSLISSIYRQSVYSIFNIIVM